MSEINNRHTHSPWVIDMVMPMYDLLEYSNNHSYAVGSLWQYYRDEPVLNKNGALANFPGNCAKFEF